MYWRQPSMQPIPQHRLPRVMAVSHWSPKILPLPVQECKPCRHPDINQANEFSLLMSEGEKAETKTIHKPGHGVQAGVQYPFPKRLSHFNINGIVQCDQCLQGRVAAVASERADFPVRCVKGSHGWIRIGSSPVCIDAPAVSIFPLTGFPVDATAKSGIQSQSWLRRFDRDAIHF